MTQHFLFLQGVCSPFFPRLAQTLRAAGHAVSKINFTVGDRAYWNQGQATAYRGDMAHLPSFYEHHYNRHGITDIVLFGDCRPVHQPAILLAKQRQMRVHVFEEGYFRPYWVTLERNGVNGNSFLPNDPLWYREQARSTPAYGNGEAFVAPFWRRAAYDVGYNFWAGLNPIMHRGVKSHVPYSPATEYLSYVRRAVSVKRRSAGDDQVIKKLLQETSQHPFYLFPLQINTDAQIRFHSPFSSMVDAVQSVLRSFAENAPQGTRLLIKAHPLDPGLINYAKLIARRAREFDVWGRVFFVESGNLPVLLDSTCGVVTVNSTAGASALLHGCKTIALGKAIYALSGLTFQGGMSDFWRAQHKPDKKLFSAFRNVVIHQTQLNGGYYSRAGIDLAIRNAVPKLIDPRR
ncbi:capsule biosynthesis protein [Achromobacter kerstersii]|uniref:capsule biosynthesis protein n=1 Tax=Achromobacter kerstersii TaxID=1353890 RepID=UPI003CFF6465